MFEHIRRQLVKEYTFMLAGLLTVSTIGFCVIFMVNLYVQQTAFLSNFAYEESEEWRIILQHWDELAPLNSENDALQEDELFYYAFNEQGKCVRQLIDEPLEDLIGPDGIMSGEVRLKIGFLPERDASWLYMITRQDIFEGDKKIGVLYAGKDMMKYVQYLIVSIVCLVLLLLIVIIFSKRLAEKMAWRAMEPIMNSLTRQKEFTADASHELRTPISVMSAAVETIQRDKKNQLSDFSWEILQDLSQEIEYMHKVTDNLLTLARMDEKNKSESIVEKVDCREILEQLERKFKLVADKKSLTLQLKIPADEVLNIQVKRQEIVNAVSILLDNAIKYTPENGKINLSAYGINEGQIMIAVADNGIGIAAENQQRVFERFFRVDKSRSRQNGGTGLGLAMAKAFIEANQGKILLQSRIGEGCRFMIEFKKAE